MMETGGQPLVRNAAEGALIRTRLPPTVPLRLHVLERGTRIAGSFKRRSQFTAINLLLQTSPPPLQICSLVARCPVRLSTAHHQMEPGSVVAVPVITLDR